MASDGLFHLFYFFPNFEPLLTVDNHRRGLDVGSFSFHVRPVPGSYSLQTRLSQVRNVAELGVLLIAFTCGFID